MADKKDIEHRDQPVEEVEFCVEGLTPSSKSRFMDGNNADRSCGDEHVDDDRSLSGGRDARRHVTPGTVVSPAPVLKEVTVGEEVVRDQGEVPTSQKTQAQNAKVDTPRRANVEYYQKYENEDVLEQRYQGKDVSNKTYHGTEMHEMHRVDERNVEKKRYRNDDDPKQTYDNKYTGDRVSENKDVVDPPWRCPGVPQGVPQSTAESAHSSSCLSDDEAEMTSEYVNVRTPWWWRGTPWSQTSLRKKPRYHTRYRCQKPRKASQQYVNSAFDGDEGTSASTGGTNIPKTNSMADIATAAMETAQERRASSLGDLTKVGAEEDAPVSTGNTLTVEGRKGKHRNSMADIAITLASEQAMPRSAGMVNIGGHLVKQSNIAATLRTSHRYVHPYGNTTNLLEALLFGGHEEPPEEEMKAHSPVKLFIWIVMCMFMAGVAGAIVLGSETHVIRKVPTTTMANMTSFNSTFSPELSTS